MSQVPVITLNDGNTIPQFGFGVWQISEEDIVASVMKALEVGYRHIDTAAMYGNEEGVGKAIAESGISRDELFITTKLDNDDHARDDALKAARVSLTKLGLDYVDLYLIHWPLPARDNYLEAWQALEQIQADGLSRSIGVCNFQADHLRRIVNEATVVPAVNQIEVHPTLTQTELIAVNDEFGIKTEAWSPLGHAHDLNNEVITGLAEQTGHTPAQVILRWHLQKGHIVFPKSTTPSRIEENFSVFDFELPDSAMAAIDALDSGNRVGPNPDTLN